MDSYSEYEWMDEPNEGYMAEEWGWPHTIGCFFATCLYIIPGLIFLIWKPMARSAYLTKQAEAKKNQEIAFEKTGANYIWSGLHLGGHPHIPYQSRVLIAINPQYLTFYTYKLKELHTLPITSVNVFVKTMQTVSGGPSYVSTTNKDSLVWRELVNGKAIEAEFNLEPFNIQQFVDVINKYSV